jgi:hypothetical protein
MSPNQELAALEAFESSAVRVSALRIVLQGEEARLADRFKTLDEMTRPPATRRIPLASPAPRDPGFSLLGRTRRAFTQIDLFRSFITAVFELFPEQRDRIASAVNAGTRDRLHIARSLTDLFPRKPLGWAMRFAAEFQPGWFLDSNLNLATKKVLIRRAAAAVNLRHGEDYQVWWSRDHPLPGRDSHMTQRLVAPTGNSPFGAEAGAENTR